MQQFIKHGGHRLFNANHDSTMKHTTKMRYRGLESEYKQNNALSRSKSSLIKRESVETGEEGDDKTFKNGCRQSEVKSYIKEETYDKIKFKKIDGLEK